MYFVYILFVVSKPASVKTVVVVAVVDVDDVIYLYILTRDKIRAG